MAGAAIPVAVIERMKEVYGIDVHEGYGLTETSPVASFNHRGRPTRVGTVGTPIWGVDVEIADPEVDDRIELLPRGELGEIVVRGHNLMKGYLNLPEADAEAVVDGWFRTGDLGTKSDDDYITIVDRKKDMIVRNGYNVYPREVEEVLSTHPAVAMVAVFGVAHETHGQEIMAAVTLMPGGDAAAEELVAFAQREGRGLQVPAPGGDPRGAAARPERQGAEAGAGGAVRGGGGRGGGKRRRPRIRSADAAGRLTRRRLVPWRIWLQTQILRF